MSLKNGEWEKRGSKSPFHRLPASILPGGFQEYKGSWPEF